MFRSERNARSRKFFHLQEFSALITNFNDHSEIGRWFRGRETVAAFKVQASFFPFSKTFQIN